MGNLNIIDVMFTCISHNYRHYFTRFYCFGLPGSGGGEEGSDKAPGESIVMSTLEYNIGFMLENFLSQKRETHVCKIILSFRYNGEDN